MRAHNQQSRVKKQKAKTLGQYSNDINSNINTKLTNYSDCVRESTTRYNNNNNNINNDTLYLYLNL